MTAGAGGAPRDLMRDAGSSILCRMFRGWRRPFPSVWLALCLIVLACGSFAAEPQDDVEARLRAAVDADPKAPAPHLALARHLVSAPFRHADVDRELELALAPIAERLASSGTRTPLVAALTLPRAGRDVPMPRLAKRVPPTYPLDAARAAITGHVVLDVVIGKDGRVRDADVVRSIPALDRAARDAVKQWTFEPTALAGIPVDVAATLVLSFGFRREATPADDLDLAVFYLGRGDYHAAEPLVRRTLATLRDEVAAFGRADRRGQPLQGFTPPRKTRDVKPVYPPLAQEARASGQVVMEALVDESGNVARARVTKSIPMLDQAALDCVAQWKFSPAVANGTPVPFRAVVMVNFELK